MTMTLTALAALSRWRRRDPPAFSPSSSKSSTRLEESPFLSSMMLELKHANFEQCWQIQV